MRFKTRRQLSIESLDPRILLAADAAMLSEVSAAPPDDHDNILGCFVDDVLQGQNHLSQGTAKSAHVQQASWPDLIDLPIGFEPEGIELGRGHDFFAGAFSFSSFLGPLAGQTHPTSPFAGAIYKGDLHTGKGEILVEPTGRPIAGLSYDARTDNIYAAVGDSTTLGGDRTNAGVVIYNGTSGDKVGEIIFGDGIGVNDILVTKSAVFATDSFSTQSEIYKIPLENGGRLPSLPVFEIVELTEPGVARLNGLVGSFDGNDLVVINDDSGLLYHVDTESGAATVIDVQGEQTTFKSGDGLYLSGRTLYIMQNQVSSPDELGKIAVVQLSGDLSKGTFVKDIVSGDFRTPTTITGFGDSIYAINSHVLFNGSSEDVIFNSGTVQSEIVKVPTITTRAYNGSGGRSPSLGGASVAVVDFAPDLDGDTDVDGDDFLIWQANFDSGGAASSAPVASSSSLDRLDSTTSRSKAVDETFAELDLVSARWTKRSLRDELVDELTLLK